MAPDTTLMIACKQLDEQDYDDLGLIDCGHLDNA